MANSRRPAASRRAKSIKSTRVSSGRTLSGFGENRLPRQVRFTPFVQDEEVTTTGRLSSPLHSSQARSKPSLELAARSANSPTMVRTPRHTAGELVDRGDAIGLASKYLQLGCWPLICPQASRSKSTRKGLAPQSSPPRRSPRNSKTLNKSSTVLSTPILPAAAFPQEAYVDSQDGVYASTSESPQQLRGPFATADMHVHCSKPRERPLPTTWCRALLDTQSDENFISWRKYVYLRDRGFIDSGTPVSETVKTLGLERIIPVGVAFVKWHNDRHPDTQYNEKFLILPEYIDAAFDFLIGKKCIEKHEFLIHNPKTMYLKYYQETT
jgi:hypothetical protein